MFNRLNLERVKKKATATNNYGCKLKKRLQVVFSLCPILFCPIPCPFALNNWEMGSPTGPFAQ